MACFWEAQIAALSATELQMVGGRRPEVLKRFYQTRFLDPTNVLVQGKALTEQERSEHREWLRCDQDHVYGGHLTSTCDPYLVQLCEHFRVNVDHVYNGSLVQYHIPRATRLLKFQSSTNHFWKT